MSWQPLLRGQVAEQAAAKVQEIASALVPDPDKPPGPSLASGASGLALLYRYLSLTRAGSVAGPGAEGLLDQALEGLRQTPLGPTFMEGVAGVAWTAAHFASDEPPDDGTSDPHAEVDELLSQVLGTQQLLAHDHISGLIGIGVYFFERWPRPTAVRALSKLVLTLAARATRDPTGSAWFTPPEYLPSTARRRYAQGHYNLGLAHGVPAVIAFLGHCCALDIQVEVARPLLESAVTWLLAKRLAAGSGSHFGYYVLPDQTVDSTTTRANWCYGDPGVAMAIWQAGRSARQPGWCEEARTLLRAVARRSESDCDIAEAGLCHGAAGLGHLLNRAYQSTGDADLAIAATAWFQRTLSMQRPGSGVAGFTAFAPGAGGELVATSDPGFLSGASGIALSLLAATSSVEPAWDRALLLSSVRGSPS